jgi:glycosyltransferase involved in cell wall biosynthesis
VPPWAWFKTAYITNILAVRNCLSEIQPDLVHGQGTERDCAISAALSGYPNIITLHGNMRRLAALANAPPWSFAGLTALLESLAIRLSGGIICISTHTQSLVKPIASQSWLIPNAVDPSFHLVPKEKETKNPVILLVGDLLPNKNQLAFLLAIAPIQQDLGFTVRLLGKAQTDQLYAAEVLLFASDHAWCKYGGHVDRETLAQLMSRSTLLALPSLEENLPMVILEAMAAGLPVAASRVGGITDLIAHQKTGMLFDPSDQESIRETIRSMLADPETTRQHAVRAREKSIRDHLPQTIARLHLEVYRQVRGSVRP